MSALILGSSNEDYHANKTHLSSSSLKTLLKDPKAFEEYYLLNRKREKTENENLIDGQYVHSLILEPYKIEKEYAFYTGLKRQGKNFEEFKSLNEDKTILSHGQTKRGKGLYEAYAAMPVAVKMLSGGLPEHNMVSTFLGVNVKARADYINIADGYIADVKTTSHPSGSDIFNLVIKDWSYQLSAALYCQIAYQSYGKLFDFYWIVLSKADKQCHVYKASSETLSEGSAMVIQAIVLYKQCLESGTWQIKQDKVCFDTASYEIVEI